MLMIRRRVGESLEIGDQVQVRVLEIAGNRVMLGVEAPRSIAVRRSELEAIRRENQQVVAAAQPAQVARLRELLQQGAKKFPHTPSEAPDERS